MFGLSLTPRVTFVCLLLSVLIVAAVVVLAVCPDAFAALDVPSLITSSDFDTPKADVKTAATGVLAIFFSIFVVGLIISVFTR